MAHDPERDQFLVNEYYRKRGEKPEETTRRPKMTPEQREQAMFQAYGPGGVPIGAEWYERAGMQNPEYARPKTPLDVGIPTNSPPQQKGQTFGNVNVERDATGRVINLVRGGESMKPSTQGDITNFMERQFANDGTPGAPGGGLGGPLTPIDIINAEKADAAAALPTMPIMYDWMKPETMQAGIAAMNASRGQPGKSAALMADAYRLQQEAPLKAAEAKSREMMAQAAMEEATAKRESLTAPDKVRARQEFAAIDKAIDLRVSNGDLSPVQGEVERKRQKAQVESQYGSTPLDAGKPGPSAATPISGITPGRDAITALKSKMTGTDPLALADLYRRESGAMEGYAGGPGNLLRELTNKDPEMRTKIMTSLAHQMLAAQELGDYGGEMSTDGYKLARRQEAKPSGFWSGAKRALNLGATPRYTLTSPGGEELDYEPMIGGQLDIVRSDRQKAARQASALAALLGAYNR